MSKIKLNILLIKIGRYKGKTKNIFLWFINLFQNYSLIFLIYFDILLILLLLLLILLIILDKKKNYKLIINNKNMHYCIS